MIQLSAGTAFPSHESLSHQMRRGGLCPVSITIITSSGRPTEAQRKRKMKTEGEENVSTEYGQQVHRLQDRGEQEDKDGSRGT